jgi:hypothetical protein
LLEFVDFRDKYDSFWCFWTAPVANAFVGSSPTPRTTSTYGSSTSLRIWFYEYSGIF